MVKENISLEIGLKNIKEIRNYFITEIKQNDLMSKKHKKVCTTLKELRNCISRIIYVWSLFWSIRLSTSLHFLPIFYRTKIK